MTKSVLIIGYGSIGQRHARLLTDDGYRVGVVSRRSVPHPRAFGTLAAGLAELDPDYVVVAGRTNEHYAALNDLATAGYQGRVLVEKPLFERTRPLPEHGFRTLHTAYNLRFHPQLQRLRAALEGERICSFQAYVGQYLPDWRPGSDYRESYSAQAEAGGGALLDLSHEIDYALWLLGGVRAVTACGGRLSSLEITSDDCFALMLDTPRCPVVTIQMNYLDRGGRREITVNTDCMTYHLDLVGGVFQTGRTAEQMPVGRDESYIAMHRDVLDDRPGHCCTGQEGTDVVRVLDAARSAAEHQIWIRL